MPHSGTGKTSNDTAISWRCSPLTTSFCGCRGNFFAHADFCYALGRVVLSSRIGVTRDEAMGRGRRRGWRRFMGSSKAKSEHCLRTYEEIGILFAQIIKEMYPTLRREGAGSRVTSKHPGRSLDRYCMYTYILLSFLFLPLSSLLSRRAAPGTSRIISYLLCSCCHAVSQFASLVFSRRCIYTRSYPRLPAILDHCPDYAPYSTPPFVWPSFFSSATLATRT